MQIDLYHIHYEYCNNNEFSICINVKTEISKSENYKKGVAHFVEHILADRLKKNTNPKCRVHAETNNLYTYYSICGLNEEIEVALNNIDIILNPYEVQRDEIEIEKEKIIHEKYQKELNKIYFINKEICNAYYYDNLNIIGDESFLTNISIKDLNDFILKKYNSTNYYISICARKDIINRFLNKNQKQYKVTVYSLNKMLSFYFNIVGMNNSCFYIFYIYKHYFYDYLKTKYININIDIIRFSSDKSYFIINVPHNKDIEIINCLLEDINNLINDYDNFKIYATELFNQFKNKLRSNEFRACLTSILNSQNTLDICNYKYLNFLDIIENDYLNTKTNFINKEYDLKQVGV